MANAEAFELFFEGAEPLVRRALVSRFGGELGRDAAAEGFMVAWRSWQRVSSMENRAGYVYRTGERWAKRQQKRPRANLVEAPSTTDQYEDLELADALAALSPRQRQAVVLIEGYGLTHAEASNLLGCARSTIQNHVERGMRNLRTNLEVGDNA